MCSFWALVLPFIISMVTKFDSSSCFSLRDPLSKEFIGYKNKIGEVIYVPQYENIDQFVKTYNAVNNFDMGMAVEVVNQDTDRADRFCIIYAFRVPNSDLELEKGYTAYRVYEAELTNLEFMDLISRHKNKEK